MSAKAKLRLRHIEDAEKSNAAGIQPNEPLLRAVSEPVRNKKNLTSKHSEASPLLRSENKMSVAADSEVGETLRRAREKAGLSLRDVAQQLRIQKSYLECLETGTYDDLPGLTYAIGYVRSYAQLLDLDGNRLIEDFKAEAKRLQEPTQLSFPSPAPEGKVPGGALMFVGVLLAALSYGGWYYVSTSDKSVSDLAPGIPDRLAFLLEEPSIEAPEPAAADTAVEPAEAANSAVAAIAPAAPVQSQPESVADSAPTEPASDTDIAISEPAAETPVVEPDVSGPTVSETAVADADSASDVAATAPEAASAPSEETREVVGQTAAPQAQVTSDAVPEPEQIAEASDASEQVAAAPAQQPLETVSDIPAVPMVPTESAVAEETSASQAEAAAIDTQPAATETTSAQSTQIVISATDDSWVQVRGEDTTPLLTRILRKGESYEVPVRDGLRLFTGNAGALKIIVNGTEIPSLGPFGKIARNVPLDESLLNYSPSN